MLSTYFSLDGFLPLPCSNGIYQINKFGIVIDSVGDKIDTFKNNEGELVIDLFWIFGKKTYKVAFLLLLTFKPVCIPLNFLIRLNVDYKDNDSSNLNLENIVWRFPEDGIETEKWTGFFYIPGHTRFCISKDGVVRNINTGNILSGSKHKSGYVYFTMKEDVPSKGKSPQIGRHRLLMFTFSKYPAIADKLDVNHKNGIPGDDDLNNLEWVTRGSNAIHAFANGLRNDNRPVIVKDVRTGEEKNYFSAHECERALGLGRGNVHYRIKFGNGKIYEPGYIFKYSENYTYIRPEQVTVTCLDLNTGVIVNYPSLKKCSEGLKVSKKVISGRIKNAESITWKNFRISRSKL